MAHKVNIVLSIISAALISILVLPINCFCYTHPYLIPVIFAGLFVGAYIVFFLIFWIFSALVSLTINTKKTYEKHSRFYDVLFALIMEYAAQVATANIKVTGMEKLPDPKKQKFLFYSFIK